MKLVSYQYKNKFSYGLLHSEGIFDLSSEIGDQYPDLKALLTTPEGLTVARHYNQKQPTLSLEEVIFLPVIPNPAKILCVGMNYAEKRTEFNVTEKDFVFLVRFADSQVGHLNPVCKPRETDEFDYEGELAVIIGTPFIKSAPLTH